MGADLSSLAHCGYGARIKQGEEADYTAEERSHVLDVFRRLDRNGDGELDADDLQEALAKAYNAQVKQDVQALIERHKRKPGSDRCCITEDEWLEFNRPFVLGHKDQSSGRHGPTLLSTALLNVKEEALLEEVVRIRIEHLCSPRVISRWRSKSALSPFPHYGHGPRLYSH